MSQFAIFSGEKPNLLKNINVSLVKLIDSSVINYIGDSVPKHLINTSWVFVQKNTEPIHDICDQAYSDIQDGIAFADTDLYKILKNYLPIASQITLFYGVENDDLDVFSNPTNFLNHIEQCVLSFPCEIYSIYKPNVI